MGEIKAKYVQDNEEPGLIAKYNFKKQKFEVVKKAIEYYYDTAIKIIGDKLIFVTEYSGDKTELKIFDTETFEKKEIITKCRNTHSSADFRYLGDNKILIAEGYSWADVPNSLITIPFTFKNLITRSFYKNIYVLDIKTKKSEKIGQVFSFNHSSEIIKINNSVFYINGINPKLLKLWGG